MVVALVVSTENWRRRVPAVVAAGKEDEALSTMRRPARVGEVELPAGGTELTVSVVICAYTEERWSLLMRSVSSVQSQSRPPVEIIVCVDHNGALLERCRLYWADQSPENPLRVTVIANRYEGRLGSARNSAAEIAHGDIVAFLDDDAWADPDWLERLVAPYQDDSIVAVGGAPMPEFEGRRPGWFPLEFDWVFGCAYASLPKTRSPLARLIGANMSMRRFALAEVGGFHSDNHDDMDMCHRLAHHCANDGIIYEPMARVHHHVPVSRTSWAYFWRRCFFVNKGKVEALRQMEDAASHSADLAFVRHALVRGVPNGLRQAIRGDRWGVARAAAIVAGIALAGAGNLSGRAAGMRRNVERSRT